MTCLSSKASAPLSVRLVKGAYWDREIKLAQMQGLEDFAVYTRKAYTEVAYLACARMLHIDGHDTPAVEKAAHIAHSHSIPVSCDVDTIYPGFDRVLPLVDYLVSSSEFPARWTGERDPFRAVGTRMFRIRIVGSGSVMCRRTSGCTLLLHFSNRFSVRTIEAASKPLQSPTSRTRLAQLGCMPRSIASSTRAT